MAYKVFISHSVRDIQYVKLLEMILKRCNIEAYIAERDEQYGRILSQKIKRNIENSDTVLVLWTRNSKHSAYVNQEIGYAEKCSKRIVPLVEEGVTPAGFLEGREYASFNEYNIKEAMEKIAAYLKQKMKEKEALEMSIEMLKPK